MHHAMAPSPFARRETTTQCPRAADATRVRPLSSCATSERNSTVRLMLRNISGVGSHSPAPRAVRHWNTANFLSHEDIRVSVCVERPAVMKVCERRSLLLMRAGSEQGPFMKLEILMIRDKALLARDFDPEWLGERVRGVGRKGDGARGNY